MYFSSNSSHIISLADSVNDYNKTFPGPSVIPESYKIWILSKDMRIWDSWIHEKSVAIHCSNEEKKKFRAR